MNNLCSTCKKKLYSDGRNYAYKYLQNSKSYCKICALKKRVMLTPNDNLLNKALYLYN